MNRSVCCFVGEKTKRYQQEETLKQLRKQIETLFKKILTDEQQASGRTIQTTTGVNECILGSKVKTSLPSGR